MWYVYMSFFPFVCQIEEWYEMKKNEMRKHKQTESKEESRKEQKKTHTQSNALKLQSFRSLSDFIVHAHFFYVIFEV